MINHFTFNGTSTAQLGLIVSGVSIFGAGSRKVEKAGIPGRNGDLQIELGGFNNYTVRYTVSITKNFTTTAQQIREWLLESKGYCDLTDTYHPDEIRKACFNSDIEFTTSMLYKYGQASIQFDCLPERYLTTNTPITTTATADTTTDTTMSLSTVPTPLNISLNGNTTQEGSSGKNLIGLNQASYSGTLTNRYFMEFNSNTHITKYNLVANTTYVFSAYVESSVKPFNVTVGCGNGYYSRDIQMSSTYTFSENGRVWVRFTPTATDLQSGSLFAIRVPRYSTQTTFTYKVSDVQLEIGSEVTAYEPHISPTNPQVIHNVSGDNTVFVSGKNMWGGTKMVSDIKKALPSATADFTNNIITYGANTDGNINPNLTADITFKPTTDYTIILSVSSNSATASTNMYVLFTDGTVQYINKPQALASKQTFAFHPNRGNKSIQGIQKVWASGVSTFYANECGIFEGNIDLEDFEVFGAQSYPLYLPVENYCNWESTWAGYLQTDGTLKNPSPSLNWYFPQSLVGKQVTISAKAKAGVSTANLRIRTSINGTATNANMITNTDNFEITKITVTPTSTSDYFALYSSTNNGYFKDIQVEVGTNASQYSPYGNPSIELNKIGTYQDYIYKNGGKWYVHKAITKVDLGTLDSWNNYNDTFYANLVGAIIAPSSGIASILCTSYRATSMASVISKLEDKAIALNTGQSRCNVYDSSYTASTIGNFINSVKGVWLYYPLATPTNTEITDTTLINQLNNIEKAYSYNGTTNILQVSNDNGFMLGVVSLHGTTFTSNYKGEPIITVNSTGLIYLNGEVMEVLSAPVTINCQTMQCYNGVVNMNNEVRVNDFPEIKIGENIVGSSMALTITPNNWRH